jgi:hypothetical protein
LSYSLTYADSILTFLRRVATAMTTTMESVNHDPELYAEYHQRGVLKWFERVVEHIGIDLNCVKLSLKSTTAPPYYSKIATLIVLPDPAVPDFEGKMVYGFGVLTETAVQSAARKMTMELLAQFWQTKFADSSFRLLPLVVLPNEDPEAVYLEMYSAPVQETGGDQPMVHTTGSYLYDLDHLAVNLSQENEQLHLGFYESVTHIHVLLHEIQGWNQIYTTARREARRNQVCYMEANMMRQTQTEQRMAAEAKLLQTETELQKLREEKAEWELKEKDYLTTISKLKDRATDSEAECRQLQTQVDDQQDFMTLHGYFEAKVEDQVKELETRLERNKRNIALLTRTAVYLRDMVARALQTWEISDSIRVDEIH